MSCINIFNNTFQPVSIQYSKTSDNHKIHLRILGNLILGFFLVEVLIVLIKHAIKVSNFMLKLRGFLGEPPLHSKTTKYISDLYDGDLSVHSKVS